MTLHGHRAGLDARGAALGEAESSALAPGPSTPLTLFLRSPTMMKVVLSITLMEVTMRTTKILSLSIPPELLRQAERVAKEEGRTKSELFREALRRYVEERRWRALQRYGATQMRRLGLTETDIERAVEESRRAPARAPRHR
jgi:CopG family transcriptional regulator/antitoxin EndoAI